MKSADYWKTRFQSIEEVEHKKAAACYQEIDANFQTAIREVENKISVWYQRFADNNQISLQEARKLLDNRELAELKWDVKEYIQKGKENALTKQWVKELENASARAHISRYEAMKIQLQQIAENAYGNSLDQIDDTVRKVYTDSVARTAFEVQRGLGVGWDFATPSQKAIDKVIYKPWAQNGQNFSSNIWSQKERLVNELHTTFTQGLITGKDPSKLIKAMSDRLSVSKSNAGRLVMTESAYFAEQAQRDCFSDLGVEQYQIEATLDGRTSEICRSLDQKVFKMSEWEVGVTAPPFHPWCRTTTVPYFGDEAELGITERRMARDENGKVYEVPGDMNYRTWKEHFADGGNKDGLREIQNKSKIDLKENISKVNAEIERLKKEFSDQTDGYYTYDDWFAEFDSIEEGFGEADEDDLPVIEKMKSVSDSIKRAEAEKAEFISQKEKRSQLDNPNGPKDFKDYPIEDEKVLSVYNKSAFEQLKIDTEYSDDKATEFHNAMMEYFGGDYNKVLTGAGDTAKIISEGLDRMPVYDGKVYRGINFGKNSDVSVDAFRKLKPGDTVPSKGIISSWSSELETATAGSYGNISGYENDSVIFECENNLTGVGVQYISKFGPREAEVLSNANYEVIEVITESKYDYLRKNPKYIWFSDDMEDASAVSNMKRSVVCRVKVREKN